MQKNVRVIRGKYQFSLLTSAKGRYLRRSLTTAMCVIVCSFVTAKQLHIAVISE